MAEPRPACSSEGGSDRAAAVVTSGCHDTSAPPPLTRRPQVADDLADASTSLRLGLQVGDAVTAVAAKPIGSPRRMGAVVCILLALVLVGGCGKSKPKSAIGTTSIPASQEEAAAAVREAEVADVGLVKAWTEDRGSRLDAFDVAAKAALVDGDCVAQAEAVRAAVGDFDAWLSDVGAAPDPVLAESLTAASLTVRSTLSACAGAEERVDGQRQDLGDALSAVRARRERIRSA